MQLVSHNLSSLQNSFVAAWEYEGGQAPTCSYVLLLCLPSHIHTVILPFVWYVACSAYVPLSAGNVLS